MTLSKLFLSCTLMVFALTVSYIPMAEAGKHSDKSQKSSKHSDKSKKSSKNSDKSDKSSKNSDKSKKSNKHSDKSKKSNKHSDKSKKSNKHSDKSKKSNKHSNKAKVEICHVSQGNGNIRLISVSENATNKINKHINQHGDSFAVDGTCPAFVARTFVDTVGDCDAFGSEQPYSSNPTYFNLAVDEGTNQDGQPAVSGNPSGWAVKTTPFEWTHNLDELPADAVITSLTLQVNSYGIDDATVFPAGQARDNKLYADGTEVVDAFDFISSANNARVDYFDLPISSADDGLVNVSIDPSGGELPDAVFYDYSELVVEYTSRKPVNSPAAGFCQNGDQPSVPVTCPCGTAAEVAPYFLDATSQDFTLIRSPSAALPDFVRYGTNATFLSTDRRGPAPTSCTLTVATTAATAGFTTTVSPINSVEFTACKAEAIQVKILAPPGPFVVD